MLDDFKTELKRLGIKRIRKEEKRRQSFALVLEDKDTDENGELEFVEALNVSPERLAEERRRAKPKYGNPQSPRGRLRNDSVVGADDEKRGDARANVGKGGRRISRLPDLGSIAAGGWRRFGGKGSRGDQRQWDEERDAPDVLRFEPQQDPLTRARTWDTTTDHDRPRTDGTRGGDLDDDTIDGMPLYGSTERIARMSGGSGDERRGNARNATVTAGVAAPGSGSPDFDSIDFQTRPTGL